MILKKMIITANAKLGQAKKKGKMPDSVVQLRNFKLQCQTGEGKRFGDAELDAAMDDMNIQALSCSARSDQSVFQRWLGSG